MAAMIPQVREQGAEHRHRHSLLRIHHSPGDLLHRFEQTVNRENHQSRACRQHPVARTCQSGIAGNRNFLPEGCGHSAFSVPEDKQLCYDRY